MSELASPPSGAASAGVSSDPPAVPEQANAETVPNNRPASGSTPGIVAPSTVAGALLSGRYRLRTRVGSDTAAAAEFWQAEDTLLRRDVALTILRKLGPEAGALGGEDDPTGTTRAAEMVARALRSGSFEHPGCARLLDVLAPGVAGIPADVLGAAVTEWVPGRSLAEVVSDGLIKPLVAARAVAPLAAAAEEAHRHGLVLGCDHPQRIRITADGRAQMCFALPRPDVAPADDVRGLGAVLYTLLTTRWPLSGSDAARAGLAAADHTVGGSVIAPSRLRPGVPVELDTLALGALGPPDVPGHVHTAASMRRLLGEVIEEDEQAVLFPPAHDGVPSGPGDVWQDGNKPVPPPDPERNRKVRVGMAWLAAAAVVALGYVGAQVSSVFWEGGGPPIVVGSTPVGPSDSPPDAGPGGAGIAAVANVNVYDQTGDPDNVGRISEVIDGDKQSGWRTYVYKQQFPSLKPGVGIMVSFASAVQLSDLTIASPSAGSVVEVRSAPTAEAPFGDTVPITSEKLENGTTRISLAGSQPVTHVLLWINKLGSGNVTEINELQFERAG